jgi:hypothetical protein
VGEIEPHFFKELCKNFAYCNTSCVEKNQHPHKHKTTPNTPTPHTKPKKKSIAPNNLINNFYFVLTSINWSINNQHYNNKLENKKLKSRIDGK